MVEHFGPLREPQRGARGWKAIAAAWMVVLVAALLLVVSHVLRTAPTPDRVATPAELHAVIPRHAPVCTGAELPTQNCVAPDPGYPDW